jgi:hypothetical protein
MLSEKRPHQGYISQDNNPVRITPREVLDRDQLLSKMSEKPAHPDIGMIRKPVRPQTALSPPKRSHTAPGWIQLVFSQP